MQAALYVLSTGIGDGGCTHPLFVSHVPVFLTLITQEQESCAGHDPRTEDAFFGHVSQLLAFFRRQSDGKKLLTAHPLV